MKYYRYRITRRIFSELLKRFEFVTSKDKWMYASSRKEAKKLIKVRHGATNFQAGHQRHRYNYRTRITRIAPLATVSLKLLNKRKKHHNKAEDPELKPYQARRKSFLSLWRAI